jgi:hypothetical protein
MVIAWDKQGTPSTIRNAFIATVQHFGMQRYGQVGGSCYSAHKPDSPAWVQTAHAQYDPTHA